MATDERANIVTTKPRRDLLNVGERIQFPTDNVTGTILGYTASGNSYRVAWDDGYTDGAEPYGSFVDANAVEAV